MALCFREINVFFISYFMDSFNINTMLFTILHFYDLSWLIFDYFYLLYCYLFIYIFIYFIIYIFIYYIFLQSFGWKIAVPRT